MVHPITESLLPLDPPLRPDESIEAYVAATHRPLPQRHAFAIVIHRSSTDEPTEIVSPVSLSPETHNQRGNLAALLTFLELLEKSGGQQHEVVVYSPDDFILMLPHRVAEWADDRNRHDRDLYVKLAAMFTPGWPRLSLRRPPSRSVHSRRRDRALALANLKVERLFEPVK